MNAKNVIGKKVAKMVKMAAVNASNSVCMVKIVTLPDC